MSGAITTITAAIRWIGSRPGYLYMTAEDRVLENQCPGRFRYAWAEVFVFSLCWSLLSLAIWGTAWKLFGETSGRVMPAVSVAVVFVLWPYRMAISGGLRIVLPQDQTWRAVAGSALLVVLTMALVSLKRDWRHDPYLPAWLAWIRPWEKMHRTILLMPLWGAWAMFVTPQFCRKGQAGCPATVAFVRGCSPVSAAATMGLLIALTITYYNYLGWWQLPISAVAASSAVLSGLVFAGLSGGPTRRALLAANVATQIAFLLASIATCNLVFW